MNVLILRKLHSFKQSPNNARMRDKEERYPHLSTRGERNKKEKKIRGSYAR